MKRIQKITSGCVLGCAVWLAAIQVPLPWSSHMLVLLAPLLLLVAFGLYMFVLLVYGALSFRSCPEEASALHQDICRARDSLTAQGYVFSDGLTR